MLSKYRLFEEVNFEYQTVEWYWWYIGLCNDFWW